jgi:GT2 family glycosyltransferase/CII-binding regulator of phage lambda lysogenization HflD
MFNPLEFPSCLDTPDRLTETSSWHTHIPLAFAVIEMLQPRVLVELGVHRGDSYCAFCQAVSTLSLGTACYAVDSWRGDTHSGLYDDSVYQELKAYHDRRYANFSTLLRCRFDEALGHFRDGSVDLLHIDGLHTYEAVTHDFDSWLPKLSDRGVVLLHDTNVHDGDFGVWRLWEELKDNYPSCGFKHGYGLGMLLVGRDVPQPLRRFVSEASESTSVAKFFHVLGSHIAVINEQARRLETAGERIREAERLAQHADTERARMLAQLESEIARVQALEERVREMEAIRDHLGRELQAREAQLSEEAHRVQALEERVREMEAIRDHLGRELQAREAQLSEEAHRAEALSSKLSELKAELSTLAERVRLKDQDISRLDLEMERLRVDRDRDLEDLRALQATRTVRCSRALSMFIRCMIHAIKGLVRPPPAVEGALDLPDGNRPLCGSAGIAGWALSTASNIVSVCAWLAEAEAIRCDLRYGHERPDVVRARPWQQEHNCGFSGTLDLRGVAPGPKTLVVCATDARGHQREFVRQIVIGPIPGAEGVEGRGTASHLVTTSRVDQDATGQTVGRSVEELNKAKLRAFLAGSQALVFPEEPNPVASIVIPTFNKAHHTYALLENLRAGHDDIPFELIIVDNASSDETRRLLGRLKNVRIHLNKENLGFGTACGAGARLARGEYLWFLNSDVLVQPGCLRALVETMKSYSSCGAVGGKLVYPDGRLQEAGSVIWRDGSACGYGRGEDPLAPEYCYVREVDYCSAACLMVRRDLFFQVGGFDERYAPAYYEDSDLCMAIREAGYKIIYQPRAIVFHHEYGSSDVSRAISLQITNQVKFVERWKDVLSTHLPPTVKNRLRARDRRPGRRVLVVDDRIPLHYYGSGFPRTRALLNCLVDLGYVVTFLPRDPSPDELVTPQLQQRGIEVLYGITDILKILEERSGLYDVIVVSRPHNAVLLEPVRRLNPHAAVIYDAEALYALRDVRQAEVEGRPLPPDEIESRIRSEVEPAQHADAVVTVSEVERQIIQRYMPGTKVAVWSYPVQLKPTASDISQRRGLLFVGYLATPPNADALRHFLTAIFPHVKRRLDCELIIAGAELPADVSTLASAFKDAVKLAGYVENLQLYYERTRIFVAPHRFGAGIPLKVVEAMAHGVPCVISDLLGEQLGITDGVEAMVARDANEFLQKIVRLYEDSELWRRVRENALQFVGSRFDADLLGNQLEYLVSGVVALRDHAHCNAPVVRCFG